MPFFKEKINFFFSKIAFKRVSQKCIFRRERIFYFFVVFFYPNFYWLLFLALNAAHFAIKNAYMKCIHIAVHAVQCRHACLIETLAGSGLAWAFECNFLCMKSFNAIECRTVKIFTCSCCCCYS